MSKQAGFTFLELAVSMGLMSVLLSIATFNLIHAQQRATLNTSVSTLVADTKQQQLKAMVGDTEGRASASNYGIHVDSSDYVLFHGTYSSSDTTNTKIGLPDNIEFQSPYQEMIFAQITGELPQAVTLVLVDTTNDNKKTIQVSKYGVITSVD